MSEVKMGSKLQGSIVGGSGGNGSKTRTGRVRIRRAELGMIQQIESIQLEGKPRLFSQVHGKDLATGGPHAGEASKNLLEIETFHFFTRVQILLSRRIQNSVMNSVMLRRERHPA